MKHHLRQKIQPFRIHHNLCRSLSSVCGIQSAPRSSVLPRQVRSAVQTTCAFQNASALASGVPGHEGVYIFRRSPRAHLCDTAPRPRPEPVISFVRRVRLVRLLRRVKNTQEQSWCKGRGSLGVGVLSDAQTMCAPGSGSVNFACATTCGSNSLVCALNGSDCSQVFFPIPDQTVHPHVRLETASARIEVPVQFRSEEAPRGSGDQLNSMILSTAIQEGSLQDYREIQPHRCA